MGDIGDAIEAGFKFGLIVIAISVPLAIWKLVDIAIWIWNNVEVGLK